MERKISLADVQKAVDGAYENFKSIKEGELSPILGDVDPKSFGISVVLADGRVVEKGDTKVAAALGSIAKIPTAVVLLEQNTPEEIVKKSSSCCKCADKGERVNHEKDALPFGRHGVRAVSAIVPQNDPEGKYDILINTIVNMAGSAPVLNDKLYETYKAELNKENAIDKLAKAEYALYDDASIALDIYAKLRSLQLNTNQLATLGATVAADGVNPVNNQVVFDGSKAASVVTLMTRSGRKHGNIGWMMRVGLPAKFSFSGLVLAVLPGFGAIAAYSPELSECGRSVKAVKAVEYIANQLQLNVYASARVSVEK